MQPVGICADFDLMGARKLEFRQKSLHQSLIARGGLHRVLKIITTESLRRNHIQILALRTLAPKKIVVSITEFDESAVAEILLVLDAGEVLVGMQVGCSRDGIERPESHATFVIDAREEVGEENIGGRQVHLRVQEIAAGPAAAGILTAGKSGYHGFAIFRLQSIGEPGASADNRAREAETRIPVSQVDAVLDIDTGNEVG